MPAAPAIPSYLKIKSDPKSEHTVHKPGKIASTVKNIIETDQTNDLSLLPHQKDLTTLFVSSTAYFRPNLII